tara:strand:- start:2010 stop:2183 length:174 start_codon:yes stop_codon:yes gene_type:complete
MKITVKHKDTTITVDEGDYRQNDRLTSIKFKDQQELLQKTLIVMVEQCKQLIKSDEQ